MIACVLLLAVAWPATALAAPSGMFSGETLWDGFWPLLAGAALGVLGAWLRRLVAAGSGGRRMPGTAAHAGAPAAVQGWPRWLERAAEILDRVDAALRSSKTGGLLLLLVVGIVLGLLTRSD